MKMSDTCSSFAHINDSFAHINDSFAHINDCFAIQASLFRGFVGTSQTISKIDLLSSQKKIPTNQIIVCFITLIKKNQGSGYDDSLEKSSQKQSSPKKKKQYILIYSCTYYHSGKKRRVWI